MAKHQLNQAVLEYRNAIKARPSWVEAHYKLAKAYEASGDSVKAYGESRAGLADLEPANVDAQLKAGTLLLAAGEFDLAKRRAELALKAAPTSAPANILMGNALAGLNESAKAVKQIRAGACAATPDTHRPGPRSARRSSPGAAREEAGKAFTESGGRSRRADRRAPRARQLPVGARGCAKRRAGAAAGPRHRRIQPRGPSCTRAGLPVDTPRAAGRSHISRPWRRSPAGSSPSPTTTREWAAATPRWGCSRRCRTAPTNRMPAPPACGSPV